MITLAWARVNECSLEAGSRRARLVASVTWRTEARIAEHPLLLDDDLALSTY